MDQPTQMLEYLGRGPQGLEASEHVLGSRSKSAGRYDFASNYPSTTEFEFLYKLPLFTLLSYKIQVRQQSSLIQKSTTPTPQSSIPFQISRNFKFSTTCKPSTTQLQQSTPTTIKMGCCCSKEGRTEHVTMVYDPNPERSYNRESSVDIASMDVNAPSTRPLSTKSSESSFRGGRNAYSEP